jgi:hypothetical protein
VQAISKALEAVPQPEHRAVAIIAEMSSAGTLQPPTPELIDAYKQQQQLQQSSSSPASPALPSSSPPPPPPDVSLAKQLCLKLLQDYSELLIGCVAQSGVVSLAGGPGFLTMTPGVRLKQAQQQQQQGSSEIKQTQQHQDEAKKPALLPSLPADTTKSAVQRRRDSLGQRYRRDPYSAIRHLGVDVIIVGRGITQAENPKKTCEEYRAAAWRGYQDRVLPSL